MRVWIHLAHSSVQWGTDLSRLVNILVTWKARNFLCSFVTVNFWRKTVAYGVGLLWKYFENV